MWSAPIAMSGNRARLLTSCENPSYSLTRERGGPKVESDPIRVQIDNTDFYASLGYKTIDMLAGELIARGKQAVAESTEAYCVEGELLMKGRAGGFHQVCLRREQARTQIDSVLAFIPDKPVMTWEGGTLDMDYTPDRLRFEWFTHKPETEYVPPSAEA